MYFQRAPEDRIDRYTGPYERWVYSGELGRPYAFPAVRQDATHVAAILEGGGDPLVMDGADVRVPPLWPEGADHAVLPFVFRDTSGDFNTPDRRIAARLRSLGDGLGAGLGDGDMAPRVRLNMPIAAASWVPDYQPGAAPSGWRPPATRPRAIVGVIDDGIPFAHRAFLDSQGQTRISHLWLQSAQAPGADRVPVGREITSGQIDALRTAHGVDERAMYRASGAIDADLPEIGLLMQQHATHGAHILGLASGNDPRTFLEDVGDDIQIIAVQLPNTVAWDTSGFGKEMFMLSALHYIFARASELAALCGIDDDLPLIANFSYGWSAGRHDGKSEMELSIEQLLSRRKAVQPQSAIVMPTGNTFEQDMHAHFSGLELTAGAGRLGWRLNPDDRTSSYMEIWLPEGFDPEGWEVRVTPPPGVVLDTGDRIAIAPDPELDPAGDPRRFVEIEYAGANVGQLSADLNLGNRWRVIVAMIPTAETGTGRRLPSGRWEVTITPGAAAPLPPMETVEIWLQRDDDPRVMGMGGRQSRLEGPNVAGFGCMNAVCSSPSVTRVAGFVGGTDSAAPYSGAGGVLQTPEGLVPRGTQPSIATVSDQGAMRPGLQSVGTVTGSSARLVGTSAAAALASRWMAANAASDRPLLDGLVLFDDTQDAEATRRRARLGAGKVPVTL